ncbi:30734_t:CDS:1, partial [Racocetra persica]
MNRIETIANENKTKFKQLEERFNKYRLKNDIFVKNNIDYNLIELENQISNLFYSEEGESEVKKKNAMKFILKVL